MGEGGHWAAAHDDASAPAGGDDAADGGGAVRAGGAGLVLLTLGAGQFLMMLDSSVMNVSIAYVAKDVGTTVTAVQTAITLYLLVMACLMILGGKLGTIIGRRRAFVMGCIIYGCGSTTTALSPNLPTLVLGWSFLEGIGAALIMPAIVALVAGNFPPAARSRAYSLVAAAGAMAVAVGPLLGGFVTTYASWRYVFAGEVVVVILILVLARRVREAAPDRRPQLDLFGAVLSAAGLALAVYGILRSSEWGWVTPKPGGASLLGLSPTLWLIVAGILILWLFTQWEWHVERRRRQPLVDLSVFGNRQLTGGLVSYFFQFLLQSGTFFVVPLFLSVVLGLSALATGMRILPLSLALLVAATAIPRVWPHARPRLVVRVGLLLLLVGIVVLTTGIDLDADASVVAIPMILLGLGIGALASQLGAVTVSALPDEKSPEVGGLQNTATNLGASVGTALAGSVMIAVLTTSFIAGIQKNPDVPAAVKSKAHTELAGGVPFISNADLERYMHKAGATPELTQAVLDDNAAARIDGLHAALAVLAVLACVALFFTRHIPTRPPGSASESALASGP